MERKGTLGKEGARREGARSGSGLMRRGGEPLEGGTGTMRQREHLEGEADERATGPPRKGEAGAMPRALSAKREEGPS